MANPLSFDTFFEESQDVHMVCAKMEKAVIHPVDLDSKPTIRVR